MAFTPLYVFVSFFQKIASAWSLWFPSNVESYKLLSEIEDPTKEPTVLLLLESVLEVTTEETNKRLPSID